MVLILSLSGARYRSLAGSSNYHLGKCFAAPNLVFADPGLRILWVVGFKLAGETIAIEYAIRDQARRAAAVYYGAATNDQIIFFNCEFFVRQAATLYP